MVTVKALTDRTIAERFAEVKEEASLWGDIAEETRRTATCLIEEAAEAELTRRLLACKYQRAEVRSGWRNGHYTRSLVSLWGVLDIRMPRARQALPPSEVLARFQRRAPDVDTLIRTAFLRGVSTREVAEVVGPLLGWEPSAQTVSRITRALDQQVRRFHWRWLPDDVQYLFLDGVTMKVKHPGGVRTKLVLVAYGVTADGRKQLLDFRLATAESTHQWEVFLADLFRRGLEGSQLRLIITDGAAGLMAAAELVYPHVRRQRCWAHKLRNVASKLPRKHQADCLRAAKGLYQAPNGREAGQRFRAWKAQWGAVAPEAVRCVEQDLPELMAFYEMVPQQDWKAVRTTNAIERCFREVRRRTRPMSCFQNTWSCERIIYAVFSHLNHRWSRVLPRSA